MIIERTKNDMLMVDHIMVVKPSKLILLFIEINEGFLICICAFTVMVYLRLQVIYSY